MATFILIHGAWHGGWSFELIQPMLEAEGHTVIAPDLPGMGGTDEELAALSDDATAEELQNIVYAIGKDPHFGFEVPVAVPGVDSKLLDPRGAWADPEAYDQSAQELVGKFVENFAQFADYVDQGVLDSAPKAA